MQLLLNQREESLSIFPSIALDQSLPSSIYIYGTNYNKPWWAQKHGGMSQLGLEVLHCVDEFQFEVMTRLDYPFWLVWQVQLHLLKAVQLASQLELIFPRFFIDFNFFCQIGVRPMSQANAAHMQTHVFFFYAF